MMLPLTEKETEATWPLSAVQAGVYSAAQSRGRPDAEHEFLLPALGLTATHHHCSTGKWDLSAK